jgi:hypothetical protein
MYMIIQCAMIIVILYLGRSFIFIELFSLSIDFFAVFTVITWALYWKAALQDPGYVKINCFKVDTEIT